jgi:hypothetical protein
MGYNIELSFNNLINSSVTKLIETVKNFAEDNFCDNFYEEYEFEKKNQFKGSHCIMVVKFSNLNINNMIFFLKKIKKIQGLYIELIYDEEKNSILYASQYYITQKMDKFSGKNFNSLNKKKSYSDDENMILKTVTKKKT